MEYLVLDRVPVESSHPEVAPGIRTKAIVFQGDRSSYSPLSDKSKLEFMSIDEANAFLKRFEAHDEPPYKVGLYNLIKRVLRRAGKLES